ncbi:hypothetical protein N802_11605 [Knoellia sinensis KCTC 19936]|uniref:DUF4935 domain-containing protein n=2 Tax=Knoellia TaxID=136099 RepID=A0A0A0IY66_9MICO|nr:hypothetical protein N802_11605 [Knoellia sinensis KCTC 19936]
MQLLALCARDDIRLVVPHVVFRESVRSWKRQADQALKNARSEVKKLNTSFGLDAGDGPAVGLVDVDAHEQYLEERLEKVGAQILGLPALGTPERLLERDLGERKPFAASGKGFRDALNWESLLELASEPGTSRIFWVSKNSVDFSDGSGGLHPDLLEDLDEPEQITWISTIADLLKRPEFASLVSGLSASPKELEDYLALALATAGSGDGPQTTDDFIRDALVDAAERLLGQSVEGGYAALERDEFFGDLDLPGQVEDMTVDHVETEPDTVQWQVYESFDGTTLLIEATIEATLSFEGFASKSDALEPDGFVVREWDWNDHVSQVAFDRHASLKFQVRVEEGVGVDYVEFESAELT